MSYYALNFLSCLFGQCRISSENEETPLVLTWNSSKSREEDIRDIFRKSRSNLQAYVERSLQEIISTKKIENSTEYNSSELDSTKHLDLRLHFIASLFDICHQNENDRKLLIQVLENKKTQEHLPISCAFEKDIKQAIQFWSQIKKSVTLVQRYGDSKSSVVDPSMGSKISRKMHDLAWSIYFLDGAFSGAQEVSVYAKGALLGEGSFKRVYYFAPLSGDMGLALAKGLPYKYKTNKNGCNEVTWQNSTNSALKKDSRISEFLRRKNVPHVLFIKTIVCGDRFWNVMELCRHGDLRRIFDGTASMRQRISLLLFALEAVEGMHKNGLMHGDLKLSNFVANEEWNTRITDFGATRSIQDEPISSIDATYPSPENIGNYFNKKSTEVSYAQDMWAIGDFFYYALYKKSLLERYYLCGGDVLSEEREEDVKEEGSKITDAWRSENREVREKAKQQYALYQEKMQKIRDRGGFYSARLKSFEDEVKILFARSSDPYKLCMSKLFSIDPKNRPSAKEVRKILTECIS